MDISGENIGLHHGHNNSDMDVDSSMDRSQSTSYANFSFNSFQAVLGPAARHDLSMLSSSQTLPASTRKIRSLVPPKLTKDDSKLNDVVGNLELLQKEVKKLKEEKNRRNSRSKSTELSPREKRIRKRKSVGENKNPVQKNIYIWFFLIIFLALFVKFLIIHQKCQIDIDVDNFERVFDENVYGQHIAKFALTTTLRNISQRMQNDTKVSKNPLVFSFHGWTGVGKNFVTKQLVHGFPNVRVTTFLVPLHFPHATNDETYKESVQLWVRGNITLCYVNMFVFDEMDKASPGLLDGLLEVMKDIRTIEMQKTWIIFIFLSNSRGHQINNFLFSKMREGRDRNELTFNDIYSVLTDVESEKPGEWYHEFSEHGLIDTFVPFLPLNKHHVHQCIEKDLMKKGRQPTPDLIETISDEMHYIQPVKDMDHFSLTGCKRVSDKVDIHI